MSNENTTAAPAAPEVETEIELTPTEAKIEKLRKRARSSKSDAADWAFNFCFGVGVFIGIVILISDSIDNDGARIGFTYVAMFGGSIGLGYLLKKSVKSTIGAITNTNEYKLYKMYHAFGHELPYNEEGDISPAEPVTSE